MRLGGFVDRHVPRGPEILDQARFKSRSQADLVAGELECPWILKSVNIDFLLPPQKTFAIAKEPRIEIVAGVKNSVHSVPQSALAAGKIHHGTVDNKCKQKIATIARFIEIIGDFVASGKPLTTSGETQMV